MQFGGQPTPWSEVEIEGLRLRSVSQILIQEIGAAGPENAEESARRACGVIQRMADQIVSADARIAELETAMKRQAAAVKMIDMSHVARAETMMQHAQVLHDQSNTTALESERQANALLTERIAELERAVTVRDAEIARLETDLELARREVVRLNQTVGVLSADIANPAPDMQERALKACGHYEIVTRLETDAARYLWLRDESGNDHHTPWCAVGYTDPAWLTGKHLDAAIDAARAGNGGGV